MVAAEVGEHGDVEVGSRRRGAAPARATTPPSRQRRRRVSTSSGEAALQIRRLRRGVRAGQRADHPVRPCRRRGGSSRSGCVVVVLPFVPVTPTSVSAAAGMAEEARGQPAHRLSRVGVRRPAARRAASRGRRAALPRPRPRAPAANSCPSDCAPRRQQNSAPVATRRESKSTELDRHVVADQLAMRSRPACSTTSRSMRDMRTSSCAVLAAGVVR